MPPETKVTPGLTAARTEDAAQMDQRVYAEILRYKAVHDGLSPAPLDVARALDTTPKHVEQCLDRLAVAWKINVWASDFSRISVPGARWLPPGEIDNRPFHERRDCADLAADNARLRASLDNASRSWKVYQDRAGLLETLCKAQAKTIDRLQSELCAARAQTPRVVTSCLARAAITQPFTRVGQPLLLA